ncbi:MAG: TonB-dependent receptor [Acidobacteriaceae bacterium]|nr:TonB-dependent receptor [Acidobacteriaceae bacterium]MBV9778355.1 TonB-dependent receptor [Acidobacteriaceae bacterium]
MSNFNFNQFLRFVAALFGAAGLIWAQTETGQIAGTVTDPTGAAIANASIKVVSTSTDTVRTTTSSGAGDFTIANLLPGEYNVIATSPGFSNFQQRVVVTVGQKLGIDVKMQIGTTGTTVEVSEAAVRVNTETQTLSQTISTQDIAGLPTISRNPYDLVKTIGNVSDADPGGRGVGVAINGQRSSSTSILLDGVSNSNAFDTTVAIPVPQDSINEFSVVTSDFTAEYGGASGGVVNVVTKAGTNNLHGSAYEFNRVSDLASNSFNNNAYSIPKPVFTRNQFGVSIAGPIIKDRLFFFDNAEWVRVRSVGPTLAVVPTPALIAASAPATQAFFAAAGQLKPNLPVSTTFTAAAVGCTTPACAALGATPAYQTVIYNVPTDTGGGAPQNTWNDVGRIDYNLSDKTQMYFRYARYVENDFVGTETNSPYAGYDTGNFTDSQGYALSITHAFSSKQVSQTKLSFNRISDVEPLGTQPVSPTLYTTLNSPLTLGGNLIAYPGYNPFGPGTAIPFGGPQNEATINEDYSIAVGKHDFRFGGLFTYLQDNRVFGAYENAVAALGTDTATAANNLTLGELSQFQAAIYPQGKYPCVHDATGAAVVTPACTLTLPVGPPNFSRSNRFHDSALYAQDSWKLRPTFTLNLGLRWEYFGPPANLHPALNSNFYLGTGANIELQSATGVVLPATQSPVGGIWVKQWKNFAPRVGFAWDVMGDGKTSIRGGYGIGYERNFNNVTFNIIQNPPDYAVLALQAGVDVPTIPLTGDNAGPLAGTSGTKPLPRVSLRAVDPNIKNAYAHQWSFSIERQLSNDAIVGIDYTGSAGEDLYTVDRLNLGGSAPVYAGDLAVSRINPQYGTINFRTNGGNSIYNALNTRLELRNFRRYGLTLRANYTWSHSIDDASSTFTTDNAGIYNLGLLDPLNPSLDRGDSDFDVRHRVVVAGVWQSPFFSKPGVTNLILGGWNLSPIFSARAGSPFTIYDSTNSDGNLYPRVMFGNPTYTPHYTNVPTGVPNTFTYLDLTAANINSSYINPLSGTSDFGPFPDSMTGRNAFRTPGAWTFNLGASKTFSLTERVKLDLRGEAFDIFNHSNLYLVYGENIVGGFAGTLANPLLPNITTTRGINTSSTITGASVNNGRLENRNLQLALRLSF